jgi:GT2 family glycosyltransferase
MAAAALLFLVALPVLAVCTYLFALTLLSAALPVAAPRARTLRFDVVVPAHDEEASIAATVESLLAVDWPRELFRVLVVADNCSDATAERAAAAGAEVLVRKDLELRGKGYALKHAFAHSLAGKADAVVVVDADTTVTANLLSAFAARLEAGARAAQADYAVRNPDDSWRTRLMAIAFAMFHELRSRGRERLAVSCGLRGNGMCFSRALLVEIPHEAFSLVEDVEYGLRIGEAGHRVHYAGEAHVYGLMVSGEKASRSQRRRWEGGRVMLARQHAPRLIRAALGRGDRVAADLAADLLVPPLSIVAASVAVGLCASLALAALGGPRAATAPFALCALFLLTYVGRGWQLSRTGLRGLADLAAAPVYVIWKIAVMLTRPARKDPEWVRTTREGKS